jgi:hypothetical protein
MAKELLIKLLLDNSAARAANRQAMADFNATNRAATNSANAQQRAADQAAKAKQRAADLIDRLQTRYAANEYRRQVRAEQQAIAAARRAADAQIREAQRVANSQARASQRTAADQQRAADRAAKAQQRAADQAAKAQQRAADRAAKIAQRQADQAQRAADRAARLAQRQADAQQRAAQRAADALDRLQSRYIARDYQRRVRAEQQAIASARRRAEAEQRAATQAVVSQDRLLGKIGEVAMGYLSISGAMSAYRAIIDITNDAANAAKQHAFEVLRVRDSLRELAAIKGKSNPDNEELRRYSDARKASGLTHEEQVTFSTEVFNALGTVSEKKLSQAEREKITAQGGQLAARLGGGEAGAKARATVLGLLPNYMQGKDGKPLTAEDVIGTADAGETILGRGAGSQTNAATQFQKVLTTLNSEGLQGKFKNPLKAAALTALATQFGPESAATSVMQAVRETQAITKFRQGEGTLQAQAETLQEAGISEFMNPEEALTKLFGYIDKETEGGKKEAIPAFLKRRGFQNSEGTESLARFFEQYKAGNFQEIMGLADQQVDNSAPQRKFREFAASPIGRSRIADAELDAAKIEQGKQEENLEILRKRGQASRIQSGADQSFFSIAKRRLMAPLVGGQDAAERIMQEQEGIRLREQELGVDAQGRSFGDVTLQGVGGPLLGGIFNSAKHSATGQNQARANQLETAAKAQAMGLPANGLGDTADVSDRLGQFLFRNAPARGGFLMRGVRAMAPPVLGGMLDMATPDAGGGGAAPLPGNGGGGAAQGNGPVVAQLQQVNKNLAKIAKQPVVPRPQGKPPGQGRRP